MSGYNDTATRRAVRAVQELQEARALVQRAGITVSMALDSAAEVYDRALAQLGLSAADRTAVYTSPNASKQIIAARTRTGARPGVAMDAAAVNSYEAMFPGVPPVRLVS